MNNEKETDRKDLLMKRKGKTRCLRRHKKNAKRNLLKRYKKVQLSQRNIYTWSGLKRRGDFGNECTTTKGKTGQI